MSDKDRERKEAEEVKGAIKPKLGESVWHGEGER